MTLLNSLLLALNLLGLVSVLRYHAYKRDQLKDQLKKVNDSLHPALFRDRVMQTECCIICHGNTPNKPAGYPRQVSIHDLCLNRYNANEIEVKRVGQVLGNKQINLKQQQTISMQQERLKMLTTQGIQGTLPT